MSFAFEFIVVGLVLAKYINLYIYNGKYSWDYGAGVIMTPSALEGKSETKLKGEKCKYTSPGV